MRLPEKSESKAMHLGNVAGRRRAYGYVRVSSDVQAERGDSLEVQRRAIELVCELEGFELVTTYSDPAISGAVPFASRPDGAKLLVDVEPGSIIVSTKLDRVFRDAHDAAGTLKLLKKRNVGLYLRDLGGDVTASNVSALVFGLLSNVAEFERSRIAERIREVKKAQRASARYLGGCAPFGFRVAYDVNTGKQILLPHDGVQSSARKLREQGYSARLAVGALAAEGFITTHKSVLKLWRELDRMDKCLST